MGRRRERWKEMMNERWSGGEDGEERRRKEKRLEGEERWRSQRRTGGGKEERMRGWG